MSTSATPTNPLLVWAIALALALVLGLAHQLDGPDEVAAAQDAAAEASTAPQQVASAAQAERLASAHP